MGCFWSSEGAHERCMRCGRRGVNNLRITDHLCEICISQASRIEAIRPSVQVLVTAAAASSYRKVQNTGPCYGEYRCCCGHVWKSRRSWPGYNQICERCRRQVYAHTQRELRPSDRLDAKEIHERHKKELCQKCQQLGYDCGAFQSNKNSTHAKSRPGASSGRTGTKHTSRMMKRF